METLRTDQASDWLAVLTRMKAYDFYYLPSYHRLAETQGEGVAELFVHRDGEYVIAIPLVLRPVSTKQGPGQVDDGLNDATSVYGYAGPLASDWNMPAEVIKNFQIDLRESLEKKRVVSVFSRLHPLFPQRPLLHGLGNYKPESQTISINLSLTPADQVVQYRQGHKQDIRKIRDMGATCGIDLELTHLDAFIELYYRNMKRVGAKAEYFFPRFYFDRLMETTDAMVRLFVCTIKGELACAAIFLKCDKIIQYHLSATSEKFQKFAPTKLLLDTARQWGVEHGAMTLHLGGGVGSSEDALFQFKAGFSNVRHEFFTWRWILSENDYWKLTSLKTGTNQTDINQSLSDNFFPAYRAPQLAESLAANSSQNADPLRNDVGSAPLPAVVPAKFSPAQKTVPAHSAAEPNHSMSGGAGVQPRTEGQKKIVRILVLGGGGHARVVADAILSRSAKYGGMELIGFLDDDPTMKQQSVFGKPVFGPLHEINHIPHDMVVIGVGDNEDRQKLYEDLSKRGEKFVTIIHPNATVARDVKIGRGSVLFAGVVVNTGAKIGENAILNTGCTVGHDCTVGPHATIGPGAHLGGAVRIRKGAFVGIGSSILQTRTIGEWAIVGGGAVVLRDVPPRTTFVGVPAHPIKKHSVFHKKQTSSLRVVTLDYTDEWMGALNGLHDFYHLPSYNDLARRLNQGEPRLLVYENGEYRISLPLLIRRIDSGVDGPGGGQWFDATSVYGYAGPVASHSDIPVRIKHDFHEALTKALIEMKVVSLFSRLHPLLNQSSLLTGIGVITGNGYTISIDLRLPEEMQVAQYRGDHRRGIRKLREMGAVCAIDAELTHLNAFIDSYYHNMERVGAKPEYFLPHSYFKRLMATTEATAKLFVCSIEEEFACAAIFLKCGSIIQYHLSTTSEKFLKYAPTKLLLDTARQWGVQEGAATLHLGGGVGSSEDSLFKFKAGFSQIRHEFFTWRWILLENEYRRLTSSKTGTREIDVNQSLSNDFFPAYRR